MKKGFLKRKYQKRLLRRAIGVTENRDFLIAHLKKEWEAVETGIAHDRRKRKLYAVAQQTGTALGFTLLGMAALCGVVLVSTVAPNIFSAFGRAGRYRRYFGKKDCAEQVRYLHKRGCLEMEKDDDGGMEIRLTEFGEEYLVKRALGELRIMPQESWDGIWRLVFFDIPERHKWAREAMRQSLKRMGFYPLQKSTFVFPYPCREEIEFLTRLYDVGPAIRFIETDSLDPNTDAEEFFSLS